MKRWRRSGLCLALGLLAAPPVLGGDPPRVEGAQLKATEFEAFTRKGGLTLAGFSWEGETRRFGAAFDSEAMTPREGDLGFSIVGKGGAAVCEGLLRVGSSGERVNRARLTFRTEAGVGAVFRLEGLTVERADCGSSPWTAGLVAETVSSRAAREQKGGKKKGGAVRMDALGPGG